MNSLPKILRYTLGASQSSLMVLAPHCELHLHFIKDTFSQHQPLVSTNIGKANVTKHKKVVQNYL